MYCSVRVSTVEPILFTVIYIEDCSTPGTILGIVLDELEKGNDAHAVVSSSRRRGHGVIVGGKQDAPFIPVPWICAVYLDENVGSLEVDTVVSGSPGAVGP